MPKYNEKCLYLRENCNLDRSITVGAFYNDRPSRRIYGFAIELEHGFAIDTMNYQIIYQYSTTTKFTILSLKCSIQIFEEER